MRIFVSAALAAALGACASSPGPAPAPAPDPASAAEAPAPPPPVSPPDPTLTFNPIRICVVRDGALVETPVDYDTRTGEMRVNGRLFAEAHPVAAPPYAAASEWYVQNLPLEVDGTRYAKYGLPRVLGVSELRRVGEFQGLPVFAGVDEPGKPSVYYVPVRPGCEFQPYQIEYTTGAVRGG